MAANGGTIAAEVLETFPEAKSFLLPVVGGGLAGGFAYFARERDPSAAIIACQHEGSPGLALSLERGSAVTRLPAIETSAGGIEGGIGRLPFEVLRTRVDRVALLSEREIEDGVRWLLDRHQILVEPSAAVAISALLTGKAGTLAGPAAIVVTGRNVAYETIRRIAAGPRREDWVRMNEDDVTMRTRLAPLEEIAERHGIDPEAIRAAVAAGEIREHRQPGDPRMILAERDVVAWLAERNRF
jgi:threonine dehydratase